MRSRRRFSGRPSRCCSPAGRCLLRRQQARGPLAAAPLRAAAHLAARPCLPEAFAPRVPSRTGGARTAHACCAAARCRKQQHLWALHKPRLTSAHARSLPRAQAALLARLRARRRSASRPARARPCWQRRLACAHISSTPAASQEGARAPRRVRQNPGVPAAAGGARAARGAARRAGRQGPGREPHARAGRADGARARASGRRPGPALQPGDCCVRGHRLQPGARRARCVWAIKRAVVTRLPALLAVSAGAMSLDAMFSWPSTRRQGGSLLACRAFAAVRLSPASGARPLRLPALHLDARLMRPRSQGGCRAVCMSRYRIPRLYVSYSGEEPMLQRAPDACPARRSMAHGDRAGKGTITSWSCALLEVPPGPANPPIIAKKKLMRQIEALHWS